MGFDYALVHLKFNIPVAVVLSAVCQPLFTKLDLYKLIFLISIAVTSTTPWDSYLIKQKIWTYPDHVIIGPTIFKIPLEEMFFFVIQTFNTTLLYLALSRTAFHPVYLKPKHAANTTARNVGVLFFALQTALGVALVKQAGKGTYMGLILAWCGPFFCLLWGLAHQFLVGLPWTNTVLPIAAQTLYLWAVDTMALRRGTWRIEKGTKLEVEVWRGLEIEEAVFFLITNAMIVFGLVAFDNALAVRDTFPELFPARVPSPVGLVRALLLSPSRYDGERIEGLRQSADILRRKSRSFFTASGMFTGRLRIDLVRLYAFCRVADDLVDNAETVSEAERWIAKLTTFLDLSYPSKGRRDAQAVEAFVQRSFPEPAHLALLHLPVDRLSATPIRELVEGFKMDLAFIKQRADPEAFPIQTAADLDLYGYRVAGVVGELVLELIFSHAGAEVSPSQRAHLLKCGGSMGKALQFTNIARDITVDAAIKRVYIPAAWLREGGLAVADVLKRSNPCDPVVAGFRARVLDLAFKHYEDARAAMDQVPDEARGPLRVAVESYMEIGRVMQEEGPRFRRRRGQATVPLLRRVRVAWRAMARAQRGPVLYSRNVAQPNGQPVEPQKTAIVIGAGTGGIGTAARLAKAGFKVTVLEKNGFNGGRCSLIHKDGWRFDQGPSLVLLPKLFMEAFFDLGTTMEEEGVHMAQCSMNYNLYFADGSNFQLTTDLAQMKREIEKWEGKDGFERYLSWLQEAHRHYELSVSHVLKKNFPGLFSMCRWAVIANLFKLHPFESMYARAAKYFRSERLRRVFTFGSMYMGMSPFDAPGTYSLLQYTELAEGIWYPIGGFNKVLQALQAVGERFGADFRFNTPVARVLLSPSGDRARGVVLESGEELLADVVVCNADLVYAYNKLLPPSREAKAYGKRPGSCSSISFYWCVNRRVAELKPHNIFLADEYKESFDAIFDRQSLPKEPSFYVNVPSRIDPSAAPPDCDALIVLVPTGHLGGAEAVDFEALIPKIRETVITTIERRTGCADLRSAIVGESVNHPVLWEQKFNLDKGAILGLSHSFFNVLSFRPRIKHGSVAGLYFVGASTHPGTGVPIVLAGSRLTAEMVLDDCGVPYPWDGNPLRVHDQGVPQDASCKPIDRMQSSGLTALLKLLGLAGIAFAVPALTHTTGSLPYRRHLFT